MRLIPETKELQDYLNESSDIDYSHLLIREKVLERFQESNSQIEKIKKAYEFVRDEISHSWDIKSKRITRRASEVLAFKEGICYAKSNLLAALLRTVNIPTGFCYQRVTIGDTPESGYCIHALNAVYIFEYNKWVRLDARGNNENVNAQFSLEEEQLAFPIRTYYDEIDYPTIYKEPLKITMDTLSNNTNCLEMYIHHLPSEL
jgi:transglutaminase-like putative cysteine protease